MVETCGWTRVLVWLLAHHWELLGTNKGVQFSLQAPDGLLQLRAALCWPNQQAQHPTPYTTQLAVRSDRCGHIGPSTCAASDACRMAGGYTRTSPELRRVKPESTRGRKCVKLVYVVLEAQYQSALTAAVKHINRNNDKVCQGRDSTIARMLLQRLYAGTSACLGRAGNAGCTASCCEIRRLGACPKLTNGPAAHC